MDVNEIKKIATQTAKAQTKENSEIISATGKVKKAEVLAAQAVNHVPKDEIKLDRRTVKDYNRSQKTANQIISVLNVAEEASSELDKLVKSVDGIVKQVDSPNLNQHKKEILSNEAKELVSAIKEQSDLDLSPLSDLGESETKVEIERKLEQSLKALFNEGANNAFGLSEFKLEQKDNIIQVRTSVALAKEKVESLRSKISEAKDQIKSTMAAMDVAIQNSESSQSSLRDVEGALQLATKTSGFLTDNPETAFNVSRVKPEALKLLE
jgi:hypothetical protein